SIAQHAKPKVAGQSADLRAQLTSESSRVVITSGNTSPILVSSPIVLLVLYRTGAAPRAGASGGSPARPPPFPRGARHFHFPPTNTSFQPKKKPPPKTPPTTTSPNKKKNHHPPPCTST